jgi:hypothetical protein
VSSPLARLRADLGVTFVGSGVSAWADQSGNNNNFSQGSSSNRPTYSTVGPSSLVFSAGGPQYLQASGATLGQPSTLFVVYGVSSVTTANIIDAANGAPAGNRTQLIIPDVATTLQINAGTAQSYTGLIDPTVGNRPVLVEVDWATSSTLWQNGVNKGSVSAGTNAWQIGSIGASQTGTNGLTGQIGEVVAYSRAITATERTRITRYLGGRYGIAVP